MRLKSREKWIFIQQYRLKSEKKKKSMMRELSHIVNLALVQSEPLMHPCKGIKM